MTSLRRRTTRRFKSRSSSGFSAVTTTLSSRTTLGRSPRLARTNTYLISLHSPTVSALAFKSLMICPRTSRRCSTPTCTSSILTWSQSRSTCTRRLGSSTSPSRSSRLNSKPPCRSFKLRSFSRISKTCPLPRWTCSTSTNSSPLKKLRWLSSRTSVVTTTLSTTFASVETSWASRRTWRTQMIPKPYCTIYFRRSSSISAPTYREPARTTITRTHEAETARATCRWRRLRMAQPKILILISLK
mmetsp:Transcript_22770/g.30376  ORF Transcript_22770/g.30376 Transcript_22770/m.30376 type:complete len:244 (+) Transcript_22770:756-1487(+)